MYLYSECIMVVKILYLDLIVWALKTDNIYV